jgi:hypothetical protein
MDGVFSSSIKSSCLSFSILDPEVLCCRISTASIGSATQGMPLVHSPCRIQFYNPVLGTDHVVQRLDDPGSRFFRALDERFQPISETCVLLNCSRGTTMRVTAVGVTGCLQTSAIKTNRPSFLGSAESPRADGLSASISRSAITTFRVAAPTTRASMSRSTGKPSWGVRTRRRGGPPLATTSKLKDVAPGG